MKQILIRLNIAKLIILITDAVPGGNDDVNNATDTAFVQTLVPKLNNEGIKVLLMTTTGTNILYDLATDTGGLVSNNFTGESIITAIENICI